MENPLLTYKNQMDYTYEDMAEQFKVSRSVIQRSLEGAYSKLPPAVLGTLAYIRGVSIPVIAQEYEKFIATELAQVSLPLIPLNRDTDLDDFDIWCSLLLRINGVNFVGDVPKLSVARILKLNVSVIENFYSGRTAHLPDSILNRVAQIKELHR